MATTGEMIEIDLLQPEILSKECVLELLKKRCVPVDTIHCVDKHALVELYYGSIIPLPQRTYRHNRRGQQMTRQQIHMRKRSHTEMSAEVNPNNNTSGPRLLSSYEPKAERLKPPPCAVNFNHKVIKLGGQSSTPVTQNARTASHSKSDSTFHFVINSRPQSVSSSSGDSSARSSVSDSSCVGLTPCNGSRTVHKTTPVANVKLRRAVKLPPIEVMPMDVDDDSGLKCSNTKENDMDTTSAVGNSSKVDHYLQSAVNLINETLEAAADETKDGHTAKTPTKTPQPNPEQDEILHRKFRKIAVQWP